MTSLDKVEARMLGLIKFLMWCFGIPMIAGAVLLVAHIWWSGRSINELETQVKELQDRKP